MPKSATIINHSSHQTNDGWNEIISLRDFSVPKCARELIIFLLSVECYKYKLIISYYRVYLLKVVNVWAISHHTLSYAIGMPKYFYRFLFFRMFERKFIKNDERKSSASHFWWRLWKMCIKWWIKKELNHYHKTMDIKFSKNHRHGLRSTWHEGRNFSGSFLGVEIWNYKFWRLIDKLC